VHDELVLESPFDIAEALAEKVRERMQNALQLNVPVLVEVGMGKNWLEAH
jgi:DNA polymerase-1